MKSLLNKKAVKEFALECAKGRFHKFTRVSERFLISVEAIVKGTIDFKVKNMPSVGKTLMAIFLCFGLYSCQPAFALTEAEAVPCIVGEASGQSYVEQVAIAEALRNRGTTKGVYGCTAKHNKTEPAWVWARCKKAWRESVGTDYVKGGDHWENVTAFGKPYWASQMTVTARVGSTVFYAKK